MTEPRRWTTEELMAAAEQRLQVTDHLADRVAEIRGWAENDPGSIRTTVDVHGALQDLELSESALSLGGDELGREIVRLAARAQQEALRQSVAEMGTALGDAGALESLKEMGLEQDEDAPVLPYIPGQDPNAHRWNVIEDR
ncbi:hypothetical protein [Labedaea rhizosphaerae]|uniref:YbaB/EbfC DNA-binding family protein n=1 Tax=Labedaea rhizosphaerae TaxID=598644 RepID=A0A4R6SBT6_LABRH|nr:hypothetical protein [Labedaea rhizosphaerae]TDP97432.1 hypothetical protein EV186_103396 [Labedaea rhizosphaerae]